MANWIRKLVRAAGFDVVRFPYANIPTMNDYIRLLRHNRIDLIFDIGANIGQYAQETFALGYTGTIVSFEPMSKEHAILTRNSSGKKNWIVAPRMAVGDADGEITINISQNSVSSSVLQLTDYTRSVAASAQYVASEKVRLARLSSVFDEFARGATNVFVKMDVQGFEEQVLIGMEAIASRVRGIHLEFSLKPLYEGQCDMADLMSRIKGMGFSPDYFMPHTTIDKDGRLLQIDGVFYRR
jgi:FkbM family methyltransferase